MFYDVLQVSVVIFTITMVVLVCISNLGVKGELSRNTANLVMMLLLSCIILVAVVREVYNKIKR